MVAGFRVLVAEPGGLAVSVCSQATELRACFEANSPDLVLIDVNSGVTPQYLAEFKAFAPDTGLILWVDWISPEFVRQALDSGVRGIIGKDAAVGLYAECLHRVAAGELWLEREMSQKLLGSKVVRLSPRERQLVALLTQGMRNKEIAWRMNITEGTTKVYLTRLFEKTGASDRFELAMFVLKNLETDPAAGPSRGIPVSQIFTKVS